MYSVARSGLSFIPGINGECLAIGKQRFRLRKSTKTVRSSKPDVVSGVGRASAAELLQFNLSQPVASVVIGCEQLAPLEQNVQATLNFTPISESGSA